MEIVGLIYICSTVFSCELWSYEEWTYDPDLDQMKDCKVWIEESIGNEPIRPDEFFLTQCKYWQNEKEHQKNS